LLLSYHSANQPSVPAGEKKMLKHKPSHHSRSLSLIIVAVGIISAASLSLPLRVSAQPAAGKVPLTHETMWMMKRVGAPNPSPDGKWVVFSLVEPAYDEKDQVSDLWIVPADGSAKP
jgi:Tol biopolymer transport system component